MNSNYQPKWQSKTVRNSLRRIICVICELFKYSENQRISKEKKNNIFGKKALGKFLQNTLLSETGAYIVGVQTKEYKLSWNNLVYCLIKADMFDRKYLTYEPELIEYQKYHTMNFKEYALEKKARTMFEVFEFNENNSHLLNENAEYTENKTTHRPEAKFQLMTRKARAIVFNGWWDYDIECCAYSLISQHFELNVQPWWGKKNMEINALKQVYQNKSHIRAKLATELATSEEVIKKMLAGLLFFPALPSFHKSDFFKQCIKLGYCPSEVIEKAKSNEFISQLILELRYIWPKMMTYWNNHNNKIGRKLFRKERIDFKTGEIVFSRFNPAQMRSIIYFELEQKVMREIRSRLRQGEVIHLIHDGFFCKNRVDREILIKAVKEKFGFEISISEKKLKQDMFPKKKEVEEVEYIMCTPFSEQIPERNIFSLTNKKKSYHRHMKNTQKSLISITQSKKITRKSVIPLTSGG